ncbi:MAG: type 4a pilus biogenesis protein PilO [Burkholderiales bacterium]
MKQLLAQFQGLNPKDPGTWPPLPKALALLVLFIGILAAGFAFDLQGQLDALEAGANQEVKLKEDYKNKKQQAINLDLYRQQVREIESSFGALLKQLPNRSQMDALLVDINQAGLGRGLLFDLFKPAAQESAKDFYAELPIQLKVVGSYHDMGQFAADISQLPRIVTLNDISLTAAKDTITMDATAKTFRYLDDEEVSAQRRAAASSKAGKK